MTDITVPLNDLLKPLQAHTAKDVYYSFERINEFLKEAYLINQRTTELLSHLRSIRRPYLSTAPAPRRRPQQQARLLSSGNDQVYFTDGDRDAIDAQSKSLLRDLHAAVRQLRSVEQVRQQTDVAILSKRKWVNGGALSRWAAGASLANGEKTEKELKEEGQRDTTRKFRESVIWFLERGLEEASSYQGDMFRVRMQRELERGKSVLHKAANGRSGPVPAYDDHDNMTGKANGDSFKGGIPLQETETGRDVTNPSIDPDQLQVLEKENQDLIKHYENKLDQMRGVEKSVLEISELQTTLAMNLNTQSAQIDQLISDSLSTTENVGTGNKELKKASERRSIAKTVFISTMIGCGVAFIWDWLI